MRYEGSHSALDKPVNSKSLLQVQEHIENAAGWGGDLNNIESFSDYETAWINEYNFVGRNTASYCFSMKKKGWSRHEWKRTNWLSWRSSVSPIKEIAQWILDTLGFRAEQQKRIRDFTQKKEIDALYGR